MNFKGFTITKCCHVGSDFRITLNGVVVPRKPKKEDYYYELSDPMENDNRWTCCNSLREAKEEIINLLKVVGLPDNKPETWSKL